MLLDYGTTSNILVCTAVGQSNVDSAGSTVFSSDSSVSSVRVLAVCGNVSVCRREGRTIGRVCSVGIVGRIGSIGSIGGVGSVGSVGTVLVSCFCHTNLWKSCLQWLPLVSNMKKIKPLPVPMPLPMPTPRVI